MSERHLFCFPRLYIYFLVVAFPFGAGFRSKPSAEVQIWQEDFRGDADTFPDDVSAQLEERQRALEEFTKLTEKAFDEHVSLFRKGLSDGESTVPECALAELVRIRHSLRSNFSDEVDTIATRDPLGQLEMMEGMGHEAAAHRKEFYQSMKRFSAMNGSFMERDSGIGKKMIAFGRMVAKAFKVVLRFLRFVLKVTSRVYLGPTVELAVLGGCSGGGATICWDLTQTLVDIYVQRQQAVAAQLFRVVDEVESEEKVTKNAGFVARMKNMVHEMIGVVAKCGSSEYGRQKFPYPVEVGMCFQVGIAGCLAPLPHALPHIGFGLDINAGMVSCLLEKGWHSATASENANLPVLDQAAETGARIMQQVVPEDVDLVQLAEKGEMHKIVTGGLRQRKEVAPVVHDPAAFSWRSCLNGLGFSLPIAPIPFPYKTGVLVSSRRCGGDYIMAKLRSALLSEKMSHKRRAEVALEEDGPQGLPEVNGWTKTEQDFDNGFAEKTELQAVHSKDNECEATDCLINLEVSWLSGGLLYGKACGPVSSGLRCASDFIKSSWDSWTSRAHIVAPQPMTLELSDSLPAHGFCCANTEEDFGQLDRRKENTYKWWIPETTYNLSSCKGVWKVQGYGLARAMIVRKPVLARGARQPTSSSELGVKIQWWDKDACDMHDVQQHKLGYGELIKGELHKPVNFLGFESLVGARKRAANLVLVEFTYAPNYVPQFFCCCEPELSGSRCRSNVSRVASTDDWGMETCAHTSKTKPELPVIVFSERGAPGDGTHAAIGYDFDYPSAKECVNTVWDWQRVWVPKYRVSGHGMSDNGIAVHGITEALLVQRAPSE